MLPRDTDWRQGDLLSCEAAAALELVSANDQGRRVIVITHDCDFWSKVYGKRFSLPAQKWGERAEIATKLPPGCTGNERAPA